ncbi:MAG: bifunctional metallophosphatase/5'-nucleotidase [Bacteroidetes bacterium]|nr:MAG: bifunctional metallophosphatase/5'-nucleotidase [Bacteroidota bacterium]
MDRRSFVEKTLLGAGLVMGAPSLISASPAKRKSGRLTILHTNDTHSNIDPFPENHAKYPGLGGVARRYDLIQKIRSEEEHVLLLDSGDMFQGTPYFNRFGGELEMKVMSAMKYDMGTIGNHDFDGTMEGFVKAARYADFPFVCSNYEFTNTPMEESTRPYQIIERAGMKIGIFGLGVELAGLVPKKLYRETVYLDPVEMTQEVVGILRKKGVDMIICLSHLGYSYQSDKISDLRLAELTEGIDLILGGHTHTFLEKATPVQNKAGKITLVNQAGWAGIRLGRLDFDLEKKMFHASEGILVR